MTLVSVERHALGPRLRVVGRRVQECHIGEAILPAPWTSRGAR
jgi:hypothetical protein